MYSSTTTTSLLHPQFLTKPRIHQSSPPSISLLPRLPRKILSPLCSSSDGQGGNNGDGSPSPPPPTAVGIRFRRGSKKRQRKNQGANGDQVRDSMSTQAQSQAQAQPAKKWEEMTLSEKAIELYVGEKGLLFWLNKFAYASIFIVIGGWILFRFVGPSLNLYQLESPPLAPDAMFKGK